MTRLSLLVGEPGAVEVGETVEDGVHVGLVVADGVGVVVVAGGEQVLEDEDVVGALAVVMAVDESVTA